MQDLEACSHPFSFPGEHPDRLALVPAGEMNIDHRGLEIAMTQEVGKRYNVHASHDSVRGEGVPEGVQSALGIANAGKLQIATVFYGDKAIRLLDNIFGCIV